MDGDSDGEDLEGGSDDKNMEGDGDDSNVNESLFRANICTLGSV